MIWILYISLLALEWYTVLVVPTRGRTSLIRHYIALLIGFISLLVVAFAVVFLIGMGFNIPLMVIPLSLVTSINLLFIAVIGAFAKLFFFLLRGVNKRLQEKEPVIVDTYFSMFEKMVKIGSCLAGVLIFKGSVILLYSEVMF